MKTIIKIVLFFGLVFSNLNDSYSAPRGAVSLNTSQLFRSSNIVCGFISGSWIPGRIITGNLFYPRKSERSNVLKQAKSASGRRKTSLLNKARVIKNKIRTEAAICSAGPSQATPSPTPTSVSTVPQRAITLNKINDNIYNTEHAIFIIPTAGQVDWDSSNSWDSLYSTTNINSFVNTLKTHFPADYFFAVITASNLLPERVPNVLTYRQIAAGIGQDSITGVGVPNICRYHSTGPVTEGIYAVLDHEIGHNWGVFIGSELGTGHWHSNANSDGQMAEAYSDDGFTTIKRITGNPTSGFTWTSEDNSIRQEAELFSERDLYVQGLSDKFPELHVLSSPVYNSNGTVSYSAINSYDKNWVETRNGVRNPDYRNSDKQFRLGFVYVARNLSEIQSSYQALEKSIRQFVYAEDVDRNLYRFQVPFLVATRYRASVAARLTSQDGNTPPTITITGSNYQSTSTGSATFSFTSSDPEDGSVSVSCVPSSSNCTVTGNSVTVNVLSSGANFFSIKAQDSEGLKAFAHFVVDAL